MNARKIVNGTTSVVVFAWLLAAALPATNAAVLDPFQAYVMTPLIMMMAALATLGLYRALDRAQRRLIKTCAAMANRPQQGPKGSAGLGRFLHHGPR